MIYQQAPKEQHLSFSARIQYFGRDRIAELLEEAISDWNVYFFENDGSWTSEEEKHRRDRARTTLSIFRAVFRTMNGFQTDEEGENMLNKICRSYSTPQMRVSNFVSNVEQAMQREFPNGKYEHYYEAESPDELNEWLDPMITEDEDCEQPVMWPFVSKVIVGVRGSRVLDRWTIADLPGMDRRSFQAHSCSC